MILTWADETPHLRVDGRGVRSVNRVLDAAGRGVDYSRIPPHILKRARDRGVHVDLACDLYDADQLVWDSIHEPWVGYVKAWAAFREESKASIVMTQGKVYHPDLAYGGIFDD